MILYAESWNMQCQPVALPFLLIVSVSKNGATTTRICLAHKASRILRIQLLSVALKFMASCLPSFAEPARGQ